MHASLIAAGKFGALNFLARDGAEIFFYVPLIAVLFWAAFYLPHRGMRWFRKAEDVLSLIGRHSAWSVVIAGLTSLLLVFSLTAVAGIPVPKVADEFSYLLAADTFAHGRLTNPPHPLWIHFETFHTIQQPTYASRYPPGQGLILALGQLLGEPIIGVWLSTACACAALCWMLMAFLPTRWALLGSVLAIVHPEILFWSQRYWGGSFTLASGALTLGGFWRILRSLRDESSSPRLSDVAVMSLGMSILILCRPYEGGMLILILLLVLIAAMVWRAHCVSARIVKVGLPVALALAVTMTWMTYYNWRATRDPLKMPQQVYVATYNAAPVFLWQAQPPTPLYRNKQMRDFHTGWELRPYLKQRASLGGLIAGVAGRFFKLLRSYFRLWPLLLPFLALPWALKNRWIQLTVLIWSLLTLASLQVTWTFFHYAAPALGLFFLIAVHCLRQLRLWRWQGKPVGLFLARGCVLLSVVSLPLTFWSVAQQNRYPGRNKIIAKLTQRGGKHLVVVRYDPSEDSPVEWVYNRADIDNAEIVWAREIDRAHDLELLNYFKDRRVWLLEVSRGSTRLSPYPEAATL